MAEKSALASVAKMLQGKYSAATFTATNDRRLPTGSIRLDHTLGGGLRVGWVTSFYGEKSGGKTTTALRCEAIYQGYCRNCMRPAKNVVAVPPPPPADPEKDRWGATGECMCYAEGIYKPNPLPKLPNEKPKEHAERIAKWQEAMTANSYDEFVCAWIDMENSFDKVWAEKLGMDNRRLFFMRPTQAEEAIDVMCALVGTAEVDMLCVDSIAQLVPTKELTESMEDWQQGLQARLVNKGIRKLTSGSSEVANVCRAVTQIWINQVREKITMFGDPTVKPAGKGQEFAVHAEIKFKKSKREMFSEQYGSKEDVILVPLTETFHFVSTKDRTGGSADVEGHYTQQMRDNESGPAGRILDEDEVFKLAMHYLVDESKKGTYKLAGKEYTSQKAIKTELSDDPEFFAGIRKALLETMLRSHGK